MTIQQIQYVLSVIDEGNFTRAAEACYVTQPTLSSQVAKLEDELGMQLLDRLSKPVTAAPGALEILQKARSALNILHSIPQIAQEQCDAISGGLSIGIIPTLSQYLLPLFLGSFLDSYPELHIQISEKQSEDILKDIREFHLDCGILALPAGGEGLIETDLFYEEFLIYLPPGNRMGDKIEMSGLNTDNLLLLTEGHCLRDQIVDLCGSVERRSQNRLEFETGSLESLKELVDQQMGYTLIPELAARNLNSEQKDRLRPISPVAPVRQIGIVFHPAYSRPGLLKLLSDAILSGLPKKILGNSGKLKIPWKHL